MGYPVTAGFFATAVEMPTIEALCIEQAERSHRTAQAAGSSCAPRPSRHTPNTASRSADLPDASRTYAVADSPSARHCWCCAELIWIPASTIA